MELVVGASEATIKSLLSKLGSLLSEEYALIRGVRGDIQFINDELASMQAFLSNLSGRERNDEQTKDWMKQVRDVSYDIEDCVDDFSHSLQPDPQITNWLSKVRGFLCELRTWNTRRGIATQIADLKERARHVGKRRVRYGVSNPDAATAGSSTLQLQPPPSQQQGDQYYYPAAVHQEAARRLIGSKQPVGPEKKMQELENWVSSDVVKKLAVMSVSGFGGVGKTTVAMALYRKCGHQFSRRAMVTVSHNMDPDAVLRDILSQVRIQLVKDPYDQPTQDSTAGSMSDRPQAPAPTGSGQGMLTRLCRISSCRTNQDTAVVVNKGHHGRLQTSRSQNSLQDKDGGALKKDRTAEPGKRWLGTAGSSQISSCCRNKGEQGRASNKEHQDLIAELKEHLENNRYLLIFDDVWSSSTWQQIRNCLPPNDNKGSRIIVTTRFESVARASSSLEGNEDHFHRMEYLGDKDAKDLFLESFAECGGSKARLDELMVPDRLWKMCGGLPLPIVMMAGLVASKHEGTELEQWNGVCDALFPKTKVCQKPEELMRIISYCNNSLPGELKTCSLYLCLFPKGRPISRKRLVRRWIAEGFVSEKQGLSVEDVAEACFNQLVERNMVRPVKHCSNGKVKSCQVHDMVLEYIISKAGEENFAAVVGGQWSMPTRGNKVRRLSLHGSSSDQSRRAKETESMNLSHVRSLTVFTSLEHLRLKLFRTGIVQVLDLQGCRDLKASTAVEDICGMTLLKYLSLRGTDVDHLPQSVYRLRYLQTLDIRGTKIKELPKPPLGPPQLECIRNILGGDKESRTTLKLPKELRGSMKDLRVLSGIEIVHESTAASELGYFTGLTKLAIYKIHQDDNDFKDLCSSIQYLSGYALQTLAIDDESSGFFSRLNCMSSPPVYLSALHLSGKLLQLPPWLPELNKLIKLTLSATVLRTDNLLTLSELHSLFSLTFSVTSVEANQDPEMAAILEKNKSDSQGEIFLPAAGFKKLKLLRIFVPLLPALGFNKKGTPLLERLELRFSRLQGLHGIGKLNSLRDVILTVDNKPDKPTELIIADLKDKSSSSKTYALIMKGYHG